MTSSKDDQFELASFLGPCKQRVLLGGFRNQKELQQLRKGYLKASATREGKCDLKTTNSIARSRNKSVSYYHTLRKSPVRGLLYDGHPVYLEGNPVKGSPALSKHQGTENCYRSAQVRYQTTDRDSHVLA